MLPTTPSEVGEWLAALSADQREQVISLVRDDTERTIWRPQVGRQMEALRSEAFITGYGGAAGGGKSDLIAGLALTRHKRALIVRHEKVQTQGIIQRFEEVLGSTSGYNSQQSIWRVDGRIIEFAGIADPNDHKKFQGRPHDLKAFDEVTEMREAQVRFIMGWTRTNDPGQRARVLMTFNPPTTAEGRWVLDFFAPWLDDKHPNPAKPGELRWFTTIQGKDLECASAAPFVMFKGEPLYDFDPADFGAEKVITPKSRTFIPSRVTDNYFYVKTGYIETLQSLPEPLRSQMLNGDFQAGVEDDEWQVIPTAWIDAAMARWKPRDKKGIMDSMGVDVAVGGRDNLVISPRYGSWFDELVMIPGREIDQETAGPVTAGHVIRHRKHSAPVHVDVIGWGLTTANFLTENNVQTIRVNAAAKSVERSRDGQLTFANKRAELVWRMREALDPTNDDPGALPPDPELRSDLAAYKWKPSKGGIIVRSKDEMKVELGRSPDKGDAVCMANMDTIKDEAWEEIQRGAKPYDRYADLEAARARVSEYDRYNG